MPETRQKRRERSHLVKYLYLSNDEFWYRLEQGLDGASGVDGRLDRYYTRLESLSARYWAGIRFYILISAVAALSISGVISKFTFSGLDFDAGKLNFLIVPAIALCALDITKTNAKKFALESIFLGYYKKSDCYGKARLLASFPEAYTFDKFRLDHSLMPKYILPASGYMQHIAFAIMIAFGGLLTILLNFSIYIYCAYDLWNFPTEHPIFSRGVVITSTLAIIATAFVPQSGIFKRKYAHYGMSELFGKFQNKSPRRWAHFVQKLPKDS